MSPTETTDPSLQDPTPADPKAPPPPLPVSALIPLAGLIEMTTIVEATAVAMRHFRDGGATLDETAHGRISYAAAQIAHMADEMTPHP